jgi:hypothetical protein
MQGKWDCMENVSSREVSSSMAVSIQQLAAVAPRHGYQQMVAGEESAVYVLVAGLLSRHSSATCSW